MLQQFLSKIKDFNSQFMNFEKDRCEQVHSSINQFVVFEKFSEMNHKYDVNNFSKLIDDFNLPEEVKTIQTFIA